MHPIGTGVCPPPVLLCLGRNTATGVAGTIWLTTASCIEDWPGGHHHASIRARRPGGLHHAHGCQKTDKLAPLLPAVDSQSESPVRPVLAVRAAKTTPASPLFVMPVTPIGVCMNHTLPTIALAHPGAGCSVTDPRRRQTHSYSARFNPHVPPVKNTGRGS